MAARKLRLRHQADIRLKIQGVLLIKVLQDHAVTGKYAGQVVDPSRIQAANILLRKILPDQTAIDATVSVGKIVHETVIK